MRWSHVWQGGVKAMSGISSVEVVRDRDMHDWLASAPLAVVSCGAAWSGPSRMVLDVMTRLATTYAGRVQVAHVDTDACPDAASQLDLQSIPTVLVFQNGHSVGRIVGITSLEEVSLAIERQLDMAA